jgi:NAD+ synthase (glutamine-hydrolysing)
MKIYNPQSHFQTHSQLTELIQQYRVMKHFQPQEYIDKKISLLHQYMDKFGLKSCVVAVSGGIDSSLVLSLVHLASQQPHSPIEKIIAVSLPVSDSAGATGQKEATDRAKELCQSLQIEHTIIELQPIHHILESSVSKALNISSEN